jgi:hypothetical protein
MGHIIFGRRAAELQRVQVETKRRFAELFKAKINDRAV